MMHTKTDKSRSTIIMVRECRQMADYNTGWSKKSDTPVLILR